MLSLMTNAINGRKSTAPRSWVPISVNIIMTWRRTKKKIYNSIALADAQVAHTHEFFLDASNAQFGGG
jgi:hypothetical protein